MMDRLIAGTATLAKLNSEREVAGMLRRLTDAGIWTLDTAPAYGNGAMESVVGRFLKRSGVAGEAMRVNTKFGLAPTLNVRGLQRFYLASKFVQLAARKLTKRAQTRWEGGSVQEAEASLDRSVQLLGEGRIDVFFAHETSLDLLNREEFIQFVQRSSEQGKFRRFGLGGYRAQYETTVFTPIWKEVEVVQVESEPGRPVVTPEGWRGEVFLHGVVGRAGAYEQSAEDRLKRIRGLVQEALETQCASRVVAGFSRSASLEEVMRAIW